MGDAAPRAQKTKASSHEISSITPALSRPTNPKEDVPLESAPERASEQLNAELEKCAPLSKLERRARRKRYTTVALITLTALFLYADQNLIGPNMSAIAEEFGFDDKQKDVRLGGWLQLAFFVVGAPAALLIGYFADRWNRVRLFFWTTILGEGPCLATYWVKTYWQLFALRALTGIAVGGCLPLLFSLCGDLFASTERSYVASFLTISTGAGVALGQVIAGTVGPTYGWRTPFIITSVPAIFFAAIMYAVVDEPKRGAQEEEVHRRMKKRASKAVVDDKDASKSKSKSDDEIGDDKKEEQDEDVEVNYTAQMTWKKVRKQMLVKTNMLVLSQGLPGVIPWGVLNSYFVDYLHKQRGMRVEMATVAITVYGAGAAVGTILGGYIGQRLYNRKASWLPLLLGASTALGAVPAYYYINVHDYGPDRIGLYLTCLIGGVLSSITPPNVRAILLNVNPPELRGSIFAAYTLVDDIGKGAGPAMVAGFIVGFGRRVAFNIAFSFWFLCGIVLACITFTIDHDLELQARMVLEGITESGPGGGGGDGKEVDEAKDEASGKRTVVIDK